MVTVVGPRSLEDLIVAAFGNQVGFLWVGEGEWNAATRRHDPWHQQAYAYPERLAEALDYVTRAQVTRDTYWAAQLSVTADSKKATNIVVSTIVAADLDTCDPSKLLVPPSYLIESSPGRWQAIWRLEAAEDAQRAAEVARRIAYHHADDGADKSGWDIGQFLRWPYTFNHKYPEKPAVQLTKVTDELYRLSDFNVYPVLNGKVNGKVNLPLPQVGADAEAIIERYASELPKSFPAMWSAVPDKDWSAELWHVIGMCRDAGMTAEEAYAVALPCGSNKFARDGRPDSELWRDVKKKYAEAPTEAEEAAEEEPLTRSLAEYRAKVLRWLWPDWIPLGKLSIFDGDPGLGKSVVTLDVIARVTTGRRFPQCAEVPEEPRDVIICAAEDDIEDTIKPRLMAAGADLSRVHTIALKRDKDGNLLQLEIPKDVRKIAAAVRKHKAALVVIDPIMGYLGEEIKSYTDASVRKALSPLKEMAEETGCAVVLVRHLNKDGDLKKAIYRGGGSIAFTGAARSGVIFERHPDDKDLIIMALAKANLTKRRDDSLGYRLASKLVAVDDGINEATTVIWQDDSYAIDADTLVSKPDARKQAPERDRATAFLREVLSAEPMSVKRVQALAKDELLTWSTVRDAASAIKVARKQVRDPETKILIEWTWALGES